jgi:hypothetical protein
MTGDGSVRYMDIHRENVWQGKTAAWRSAYFWCYRNPHAKPWTVEEMDAEIRKGPAPR